MSLKILYLINIITSVVVLTCQIVFKLNNITITIIYLSMFVLYIILAICQIVSKLKEIKKLKEKK